MEKAKYIKLKYKTKKFLHTVTSPVKNIVYNVLDFISDVKELIAFLFIVVTLAFLSIAGWVQVNKYICENVANVMGKEYRFEYLGGCFFKENDKWIPQCQKRYIEK